MSNDELGGDPHTQHSVYEPVAIAIKNFQIIGVRLFLDEFPEQKRTRLKEATGHNDEHSDGHHSLTPILNEGLAKIMTENQNSEPQILMPQVQILGSCGKQSIKVKLKQNDALPGPKVRIS